MPIFANEWPDGFTPGSDFVQIDDAEFSMASEPQGLIAVLANNDQGYLTVDAAKRLVHCLTEAIKNSETPHPTIEMDTLVKSDGAFSSKNDDDIAF